MEKFTLMLRYSFLVILIVFFSCGSRKVSIEKENITSKKDSSFASKIEIKTIKENNISIVEVFDDIEIIPIDTTKSILVDGKEYRNVKIKKKRKTTKAKDTTKTSSVKKEESKGNVKSNEEKVVKRKEVDKKEALSFIIYSLLAIFIFLFLILTYRRVNKTLF